MALLWLHLVAPPLLSPRSLSVVVPASGMGMGLQPAPGDGPPHPLYFFLQGGHGSQGPLVGFPFLGKPPFHGGVPVPSPGGFAPWRLDIDWIRFLHHLGWFTPFLPQVVF